MLQLERLVRVGVSVKTLLKMLTPCEAYWFGSADKLYVRLIFKLGHCKERLLEGLSFPGSKV